MPAAAMSAQLTLVTVYITFAMNYIRSRRDDLGAVTRAYIERTILETIDGADFPIAYKMAYYNAILNTSQFTSFWLALQMEWGFLDYQIIRYAIDGSLVHQDLTPPDNKRHVHFDDDDDEDDDDSDANDDDSADTSASAPRASPPPSDNAGAGAGSSVSSAAPSGRTGRSASLPVQSSSAPAPAGRSCRSASPQGRTSPSPPPGPTPSILFTPEDIYKWTVNNGKKGPKKESNAGPMTKKAGVTKPLKGILKK